MKKCSGGYDGVPEYQLLVRAFTEQVFVEEDGSLRLKTAEDGEMNSTILQNPSDPDAATGKKQANSIVGILRTLQNLLAKETQW